MATLKKLYVGSPPLAAAEDKIVQHFGQHGAAHSAALGNDGELGGPRGLGSVGVDDEEYAGGRTITTMTPCGR